MTQAPPPPGGYQAAPPPGAGYGYGNVPAAGGPVGKLRSPGALWILSIITLGIYYWVYSFKTSNEIKAHSGVGVGGGVQLVLAIFTGVVPLFLIANDTSTLRKNAGMEPKVSAITGLWFLLPIFGILVWSIKVQGALNEYWTSRGATK